MLLDPDISQASNFKVAELVAGEHKICELVQATLYSSRVRTGPAGNAQRQAETLACSFPLVLPLNQGS